MINERSKLIQRFRKCLDTTPHEDIVTVQCANIAEEYADGKVEERMKKISKAIPITPKTIRDFNKNSEIIAHDAFGYMVADEGLFPNHSDKDIWVSGFKSGLEWLLKQVVNIETVDDKAEVDINKNSE